MFAGIREFIITTPQDPRFERLLGDGQNSVYVSSTPPRRPRGLADAFIVGRLRGNDRVAIILGDNILWARLPELLMRAASCTSGATIFDAEPPKSYGVVELDANGA